MKKIIPLRQLLSLTVVLLSLAITFSACESEKEEKRVDLQEGILKNLTGLDGCGWIIQLTDSTKLEPINLKDFNIVLEGNKKVYVQYRERTDLGSYCMVGKVVEIENIEY